MRFLLLSALKDLRRLRRDPVGVALWIGIPLFVLALLWVLFGRSPSRPQGCLLVADEDGSFASALLTGAFRQGPLAEMLLLEKLPRQQAEVKIRRGEATALLIIPEGFGAAVLRGEPSRLTLLTNPAQRILPALVEETLSALVEGTFYLQTLAGEELRGFSGEISSGEPKPSEKAIAEFSVGMSRIGRAVAGWLDPPRIRLEAVSTRPSAMLSDQFAGAVGPGMVFLALLFVALGLGSDLCKERRAGTLLRLMATPRGAASLLAGKLLAAAAVLGVVALVGLSVTLGLSGGAWSRLWLGALWAVLAGSVFYLLLALLPLYAGSERAANMLSNLVGFPLLMLGGSFFPFEAMPESLARIGKWTPNGWALVQLREILEGAADWSQLVRGALALSAVGALAFWVAARRLGGGFLR